MQLQNRTYLSSNIEEIRQNWGWFLALGIFLIIAGISAMICAVFTTFFTVLLLSMVLIFGGIANIIHAFWARRWSGFFLSLLIGILYGFIGLLFFTKPLEAVSTLTLLMGCVFIVSGLFKACSCLAARFDHWGWELFSGLVSLFLGFSVLSQWPAISFWMIGLFVGIDFLFIGWTWVLFSLAARSALKIGSRP